MGQAWGQRNKETAGYGGSQASMNSPNPPISSGWAAGPTAVTNLTSYFIEAGLIKDCRYDCKLHPYVSAVDVNGRVFFSEEYGIAFLDAATYHDFGTQYNGSQTWEADWCYSAGCFSLLQANLGSGARFTYVVSGGESSTLSTPIGVLTTTNNQFRLAGTQNYYLWCYTSIRNTAGALISICQPNQTWTISD